MKTYRVCIESYLSNNSDQKEYDGDYIKASSWEEAMEQAKKYIEHWNKISKGVIYNIYDLTPHN